MKKKKPVSDLLAKAMTRQTNFGPLCWAQRLKGDAATFVKDLEKQSKEELWVNPLATQRILREEFGLSLSPTRITYHFKRGCKCFRLQGQ